MPRRSDNQHVKATPHFDSERENIINNPTSTAGAKVGIQFEAKEEFGQEGNPYNYMPKPDKEMKAFTKLTEGKKVEK
ncbi:hypothetical protein SAMN05518871_103368 [Psychrobacillus sp. OK028]|uniref:hypothetical protein n=1 Tax=Psychrobacillus sp. OK028 TaxID=1884359 RepID=UPI0008872C42|nr:hypothetical protein [Psychrobacillus sp. OK028]SDN12791.1 hypothetical protein SAMN05518871_103368 [Psychrobacillus sp. OK028]